MDNQQLILFEVIINIISYQTFSNEQEKIYFIIFITLHKFNIKKKDIIHY